MSLQQLGGLFYCDYPVQAQTQGDSFNLPVTAGVTFVNDTAAVSAQFLTPVVGGLPTETNTQLLQIGSELNWGSRPGNGQRD